MMTVALAFCVRVRSSSSSAVKVPVDLAKLAREIVYCIRLLWDIRA